jgi:hypothetical protein
MHVRAQRAAACSAFARHTSVSAGQQEKDRFSPKIFSPYPPVPSPVVATVSRSPLHARAWLKCPIPQTPLHSAICGSAPVVHSHADPCNRVAVTAPAGIVNSALRPDPSCAALRCVHCVSTMLRDRHPASTDPLDGTLLDTSARFGSADGCQQHRHSHAAPAVASLRTTCDAAAKWTTPRCHGVGISASHTHADAAAWLAAYVAYNHALSRHGAIHGVPCPSRGVLRLDGRCAILHAVAATATHAKPQSIGVYTARVVAVPRRPRVPFHHAATRTNTCFCASFRN